MIELIKEIIEQDGLAEKNRKREIIHRRIYLFSQLRKNGHTLQEIINSDLLNYDFWEWKASNDESNYNFYHEL